MKITGAIVDNKSGHFVVTHDSLLRDLRGKTLEGEREKFEERQHDPYPIGD